MASNVLLTPESKTQIHVLSRLNSTRVWTFLHLMLDLDSRHIIVVRCERSGFRLTCKTSEQCGSRHGPGLILIADANLKITNAERLELTSAWRLLVTVPSQKSQEPMSTRSYVLDFVQIEVWRWWKSRMPRGFLI